MNCDDVLKLKPSLVEEEPSSVYSTNKFYIEKLRLKSIKLFDKAQSTGAVISSRRPCSTVCQYCLNSPRIESTSVRVEAEQLLCDKCVTVKSNNHIADI